MNMEFLDNDPISSHRFLITIDNEIYGAFAECTLPALEFETEDRKEGGLNTHVHVLATRRKSGRLTLKRGVLKDSMLLKWFEDLLAGRMNNVYRNVSVVLFNEKKEVTGWWFFSDAFPVKWTAPQFKADAGAIAIETLELVVHEYYLDE